MTGHPTLRSYTKFPAKRILAMVPVFASNPTKTPPGDKLPIVPLIDGLDGRCLQGTVPSDEYVKHAMGLYRRCDLKYQRLSRRCRQICRRRMASEQRSRTDPWYQFINPDHIARRIISFGGQHAFDVVHTRMDSLASVVTQGRGSRHILDPQCCKSYVP